MKVETIKASNWVEDEIKLYRYADGRSFKIRSKDSYRFWLEPDNGSEFDLESYVIRGEGWAGDFKLGSVFKFDDDKEFKDF